MRSSDGPRGSCSMVLYARDTINCEVLSARLPDGPHVRVPGYGTTTDRVLELVDREAPDLVLGHADDPPDGTLRLVLAAGAVYSRFNSRRTIASATTITSLRMGSPG